MYIQRESFIVRNWLTNLWGLASPKSITWGPRKELMLQLKSEGDLEVEFLPPWGTSVFLRPLIVWMRFPRLMEANLLYSKSADLNDNHN